MSMENFVAFVDKTLIDDGLRMQLCAAVEAVTNADVSRSTVVHFATKNGFAVDEQDAALFQVGLKSSLVNSGALPNVELTEDELELVAGGAGNFQIPNMRMPNSSEETEPDVLRQMWEKMGLLQM